MRRCRRLVACECVLALLIGHLGGPALVAEPDEAAAKSPRGQLQQPAKRRAPEGRVHIRVLSFSAPPARPRTLEVTAELSCDGKTPIVIRRSDLRVSLRRLGDGNRWWRARVVCKDAEPIISVVPGKPLRLTASVSEDFNANGPLISLDQLPAGRYPTKFGTS
jgi:hypothetical protein